MRYVFFWANTLRGIHAVFGYIAGYKSAVKMLTTTHGLLCSMPCVVKSQVEWLYLQSLSGHLLPQTGFIPQISCQENEEWTLYEGKKKVLSLEHASGRWLVSGSPCFIIQDPFSFPGPKEEGLTSLQRWAEFGVYVGWFLSYSWVQKSLLCHL